MTRQRNLTEGAGFPGCRVAPIGRPRCTRCTRDRQTQKESSMVFFIDGMSQSAARASNISGSLKAWGFKMTRASNCLGFHLEWPSNWSNSEPQKRYAQLLVDNEELELVIGRENSQPTRISIFNEMELAYTHTVTYLLCKTHIATGNHHPLVNQLSRSAINSSYNVNVKTSGRKITFRCRK